MCVPSTVRPVISALALGLLLVTAASRVSAQDRSYIYDAVGNLKSIGQVDLQTDPFNCGTFGNKCNGGSGMCQMGQCVAHRVNTPPPAPFEGVVCSVFDDGYSNLEGPSDAIFVSGRTTNNEQGKACIPG